MTPTTPFTRHALSTATLLAVVGAPMASGQLLLRDDFDVAGTVDPTVWRLPFGSEGTFVGRTQYRGDPSVDLPLQGVAEAAASDGFVTELHLDTFSIVDPGNQFLGTDLLTKRNFARGGGLTFEARMRLDPTAVSSGTVGGFFTFDVTRDSPPGAGNLVRDEIDWELLGNQTAGAATQDPATNLFSEAPFTGPGAGGVGLQFHDIGGFDLTQFNDYKVEWTPDKVEWSVNGQVVRTDTTNVPDDPQKLHFNIWAPDSDFADAFDAALQPAATAGANQRFTLQVDHVEVNRINTDVSANLLTDGSFESLTPGSMPTFIGGVPATTTGDWLSFGNAFVEAEDAGDTDPAIPNAAPDGDNMLKMFGPFNGLPDASGVLQNVAATPGQEFEASVKVLTPAADSIVGNENFNTVSISFLDASGAVIQEAFADPANLIDSNARDFPLLDGRDANAQEDVFIEGTVNAIAPAGTAFARVSLFFIQLNNEGGASWFDDASLTLLTALDPAIPGDLNGDGAVDGNDFGIFAGNFGINDGSATPEQGDLNGDGNIDGNDFGIFAGNFGTGTGATAAVPEPASLALLSLGGLLALRRRRSA